MGRRRKQVTPGKVWATDRRTTRRYYLFRPDQLRRIEQAFWYCVGVSANKYGIRIIAGVLMSTHAHLIYQDPLGLQPLFKRDFHRNFAHCIKAILGWPEEVFNKDKGGEREPLNEEALIEEIAYAIANPPKALAVRYAKDWPGAKTLPQDIGTRVIRVARPDVYFDPNNPDWPETVELKIHMPDSLEDKFGADEARRLIAARVAEHESNALADSKHRNIPFKGARRVVRTPHTARARSHELFGKTNPRFSAAGDLELARQKVVLNRQFDSEYDRALARWTAGHRRVVFPYGTWWMRVHHGVRVQPPP